MTVRSGAVAGGLPVGGPAATPIAAAVITYPSMFTGIRFIETVAIRSPAPRTEGRPGGGTWVGRSLVHGHTNEWVGPVRTRTRTPHPGIPADLVTIAGYPMSGSRSGVVAGPLPSGSRRSVGALGGERGGALVDPGAHRVDLRL